MDDELERYQTIIRENLDEGWIWIAKSAGLFLLGVGSYLSALVAPHGGRFFVIMAPYAIYRLIRASLYIKRNNLAAVEFETLTGIKIQDQLPKYLIPLTSASWPAVIVVLLLMWAAVPQY